MWLQASPETIYQRVSHDATTGGRRPNLTTAGGLSEIVDLLRQQAPWYSEAASLAIDTEGKTPDEVAEEIQHRLPFSPQSTESA